MMLSISRRTVLRGLGATLALPFLEIMRPGRGFAAASNQAPRRMAFVFFPNGAIMDKWTPASQGAGFSMSPTLSPLAAVRGKISILTGLSQVSANDQGEGDGDHARSAAAFLTGTHAKKDGGLLAGVSIDQIAARQLGKQTQLPSLELGVEPNRTSGQCDAGYSCAYSSNISWKSASTPMAKEIHPGLVFERLFGASAKDQHETARRNFYRKSVLDSVAEEASQLKKKLGQADRGKLDEYFTSVREVEDRIARIQAHPNQLPEKAVVLPSGIPDDVEEHIRLMYELLILAFQSDTTRVATFMVANEQSDRVYTRAGVDEGHHIMSHHQNKAEVVKKVEMVDLYLTGLFAEFLKKLDGIPEGDGTLLDHSMIVYGCAIGDGSDHKHDNLPILLAGRGSGTLNPGRHIVYPDQTPINNLYLSLLDRVGVHQTWFGDSTGRLGRL